MTNIKKLREFFGYTQDQFARLLKVPQPTAAMWETTQEEPDYETVCKISMIFGVTSDFVLNDGIFGKWNQIIEYYDAVVYKLRQLIPPRFKMPSFSEDKTLLGWLDTRLYFEPDELQLARWFSFAVRDIRIAPTENSPDGGKNAEVEVLFTPEFEALILVESFKKCPIPGRRGPVYPSKSMTVEEGCDNFIERCLAANAGPPPYTDREMDGTQDKLYVVARDGARAEIEVADAISLPEKSAELPE